LLYGCFVRDLDTIDSELQIVAAVRRTVREAGRPTPSCKPRNDLLDARLCFSHDEVPAISS
jgi:hypothetical protein